jgi:hypothetical protein
MLNISWSRVFKGTLLGLTVLLCALSLAAPAAFDSLISAPATRAREALTSMVDKPVAAAVQSTTTANDAQCDAILASTGSTEMCAVMLTPSELAAATD